MPCSACKSHGKTVFGHWHGHEACPYYTPKDASAARAKNVMASEQNIMPEESVVYLNTVFTDTSTKRQSYEGDYVQDKDAGVHCHFDQPPEPQGTCPYRYMLCKDSGRR